MISSNSDALLRSMRRWVLIAVFLLGVAVILLADVAYLVSNYEAGGISATAGVIGGTISLIAGVKVLGSLLPTE